MNVKKVVPDPRKSDYIFDHSTGLLHIKHEEDVEPVIDHVQESKGLNRNGWSKSRNWRKIGSIPLIIVEQVLREKGINIMQNTPEARKEVRRILNEFNKFRVPDSPV